MMADKNQRYQASFKGCQRQLISYPYLLLFRYLFLETSYGDSEFKLLACNSHTSRTTLKFFYCCPRRLATPVPYSLGRLPTF